MKPFSFADILFIFLTLVITITILWFVNKAKRKGGRTEENPQPVSKGTSVADERKG